MNKKLLALIPVALLAASLTANAQFQQSAYSSTIVETNVTALGSGTTLALPVLNLNALGAVSLTNIAPAYSNLTVVVTNANTGVWSTNTYVTSYLATSTVSRVISPSAIMQVSVTNPGTDTVLIAWGSAAATNTTALAAQWRPIAAGGSVTYHGVIPVGYLNAISKTAVTAPVQVEVLAP